MWAGSADLARPEFHLHDIAAVHDGRAGDGRIRHGLIARVIHWPLSIAATAHFLRENPQFGRMQLAVVLAHRRRGDEVVALDIGELRIRLLDVKRIRAPA
jgi:hypothetical protein